MSFNGTFPDTKLGFGLMRLPRTNGKIDVEQVKAMADEFISAGFTYFDTAYAYNGSEEAFRQAVVERYPRDAYTIASKLPVWLLDNKEQMPEAFDVSLRRLGVDFFDYYLLHDIQPARVKLLNDFGAWEFVNKMKAEGKIKHLGFSAHANPQMLDEVLTAHPEVDFVQLQINYLDWESPVILSRKNLEVVRKHNKPVIVMEPVKGGLLANPITAVKDVFAKSNPNATPSSFAIRFAASCEGVAMVLSGMSNMEQVKDNISTMKEFKPLTDDEQGVINVARNLLINPNTVPCTACRYCCDGCPQQINIPEIFKLYNELIQNGEHSNPHVYYGAVKDSGSAAANECVECGQCESVCPQHLHIIQLLKQASAKLD